MKNKAILSVAIHRTSSDIMAFLHYLEEPVTILLPAVFYDKHELKKLASDKISILPLVSSVQDRPDLLTKYGKRIKSLDLYNTAASNHQEQIKRLLQESLPISIELIDALDEIKEQYDILGFMTSNEAFPRERIMRDWCLKEGIPTLHVNHGLILSTPGGAYWEFATDAMTTACPNEVDFLQEAFSWQEKPPRLEITGMPSWDKYALVNAAENKAAFLQRHGLNLNQKVITFFPTIRNTSRRQLEKKADPHITGIQVFIDAVAEIARKHPDTVFFIKDRPGNEKFMQDFVTIQRDKKGLSPEQLRYAFDYAEPYVAFSNVTVATKSTIAGESVICQVPHINLIDNFQQALAFDPEINIAQVHTSELADYLDDLLTHPEKMDALRAEQQKSDALTGPARDFCSSLRVARVMAELFGQPGIVEKMDADLAAWQVYLQNHPQLSIDDLLEDANNPLRFHWRNVQSLLTFDHRFAQEAVYNLWLKHKMPLPVDGQLMAERMQHNWRHQPGFHLMFIADASLFDALADSLTALDDQIYKHFGISILSPDACPDESLLTLPYLQWVVAEQPFEQLNGIINEVESDWVLLLHPGDELMPDALFNLADYANLNPDWMALYGDEDQRHVDHQGVVRRRDPHFRPDFNLELLRSTSYTGHCVALRRDAIQALDGLSSLPYVQTEDLLLRLAERMTLPAIGHLPFILNHRSPLLDDTLRSEVVQLASQQIRQEHLLRCGHETAQILPGLKPGTWQITYPLQQHPEVVLLLPLLEWHEAATACLDSILQNTAYPNWRLCIGAPNDILRLFRQEALVSERIHIVALDTDLSRVAAYSHLARQHPGAEFYCLLETDVHCVQPTWLERLVMHGLRQETGLVAPRLVQPNGRILSAGQVLGMNGDVDDLYRDFHLEQDLNHQARAWCDQNFSALNPSCVLIRRQHFEQFGLDERFANAFYITDLGLRMQMAGLRLHWTPYATLACHGLIQSGKAQAAKPKERPAFYQQWFNLLSHDPAHNLNLQLRGSGHLPETTLVAAWHPVYRQQPRVLLVILHLGGETETLIGSLGYFLQQLQGAEKIRLSGNSVELMAKDRDLPHLVELARMDADLIIFIGEEVGSRLGQARQLKDLTGCKLGVYSLQPLAETAWADDQDILDLQLSARPEASDALFIPRVDEHWQATDAPRVVEQLEQAINDLLKKTVKQP